MPTLAASRTGRCQGSSLALQRARNSVVKTISPCPKRVDRAEPRAARLAAVVAFWRQRVAFSAFACACVRSGGRVFARAAIANSVEPMFVAREQRRRTPAAGDEARVRCPTPNVGPAARRARRTRGHALLPSRVVVLRDRRTSPRLPSRKRSLRAVRSGGSK